MTTQKLYQSLLPQAGRAAGFGALIKASGLIKSSFMFGSKALFFSASSITAPITGAFTNPATCLAIFLVRALMLKSWGLASLALVIPGLCAALYWNMNHWSVRLLIPISCFILFTLHPVGNQAALYACYWFIPMVLYFISHKGIFATALASTFVAHAVGSVIWLYTVPMTADMWLELLPLVAIERLCNAVGMVVLYRAINYAARVVQTMRYAKTTSIKTASIST